MTEPLIPLKPCPFCGSADVNIRKGTYSQYWVTCECYAEGTWEDTPEEAAEAWNTRPTEAKLLEACKAAYEWSAKYPLGTESYQADAEGGEP